MSECVLLEVNEGIATVTLNRPEKHNALNLEVFNTLERVIFEIHQREDIGCLILRGYGTEAFSSGLDMEDNAILEMFSKWSDDVSPEDHVKRSILKLRKPFDMIAELEIPVIAAINGYCLGGGMELALCADIRVANPHAVFSLPEVSLGFIPDLGGTQSLTAVAGPSTAKYFILTSVKVRAREAMLMGVLNEVSSEEDAYLRARELAEMILASPEYPVRLAKEVVNAAVKERLIEGLEKETSLATRAVLVHPFLKSMFNKSST